MKKLKLEIEALSVESFAPAEGLAEAAGTVQGHGNTRNQDTCQESCFGTCAATCNYTCKCVFTEPYLTCIEPCIPPPID